MSEVFSITSTIFSIIAVGYLCVATKVVAKDYLHAFGRYVVVIALPALIFRTLTNQSLEDIANFSYLGAYLFGTLLVMGAGYLISGAISPLRPIQRTFDTAGMACANSGFVGYPILLLAMPAIAPTALALNMLFENLIIIPLVILLAERAKGGTKDVTSQITRRVISNPLIIAMLASVAFIFFGLGLPKPLSNAIDLIAASSVAVSLFVIGGTIAGIGWVRIDRRLIVIVLGKLVALPMAVWLGLQIFDAVGAGLDDPDLRKAALIMAATPAMSIYPLLAQQYGEEEIAATAMLLMTVLSFFTISGLLYVL